MMYMSLLFAILLLSSESAISKTKRDETLAAKYHQMGIDAAVAGDYTASLGYFRSACRLKPEDPFYWNDLGVTEMRVQEYQKAKKRFLKTLQLNPNYDIAEENLQQLKTILTTEEYEYGIKESYPQLHTIKNIPQLDAFHPSLLPSKHRIPNTFYNIMKEPFIIKNALNAWNWNLSNFSMNRLLKIYGKEMIDYYPHNMKEANVHPIPYQFKRSYQTLTHPRDPFHHIDISESGTYIHWNLTPFLWNELLNIMNGILPTVLTDTFWTTKCMSHSNMTALFHINTHWKMLLIGEEKSGMFNHKDTLRTSSYQIQLIGRKKWHLCSPSQDMYMYEAADVDTFNPDYTLYPLFLNATCYQVITEPGDVIFYPKDYWHQTLNLDTPTVSLTDTLITPDNYEDVIDKLKLECLGQGTTFHPQDDLCASLLNCYDLWEHYFDIGHPPYMRTNDDYCYYHDDCNMFKDTDVFS